HPDGVWVVRHVTASRAAKAYRCPGCDQEIRPATPHVVAWPEEAEDDRRHWHTPCWSARDRRGVKGHRSTRAPRAQVPSVEDRSASWLTSAPTPSCPPRVARSRCTRRTACSSSASSPSP